MKKTKLLFMILIMVMLPLSNARVSAEPEDVPLEYEDPYENQENPQRNPVLVPEVSIEEYTLYFNTPCDGYVLRLVDEFDNVVYSTVIPVGATSLVLPSYLSGTYELQIIAGIYCFYGDITL